MYVGNSRRRRGSYRYARRNIIPCGRIMMILMLLVIIAFGVGIYQNREMLQPVVGQGINNVAQGIEAGIATLNAPTATPTKEPAGEIIQADNFWTRGVVDEALPIYEDILGALPNDVQTHYRVTLGNIIVGDYESAVAYAERTLNANPFSADAWAIHAWANDWANNPQTAIVSALHALELQPDNARARAYLAEAYLSVGATQLALNTANQAVEIDPNSAEAHRARGLIRRYGFFEFDNAMTDYRMAYNLAQAENPVFASFVALDIAQLNMQLGDYTSAINMLEGVLQLNPDNTQALFLLGTTYFTNMGSWSQALGPFQRCTEVNPQSVNCFYMLGRAQEKLELMEAAALSFAMAIDNGSQNAYHYWWAGRTQISIGNCSKAIDYLNTGYRIARNASGTPQQLISDYEAILPLCRTNFTPEPQESPTPRPTNTPVGQGQTF